MDAPLSWFSRGVLGTATAVCLGLTGFLQAADQTWLQGNANNDWSLTAPNWDAGLGWTNGNNAIFGGTGETVELASDVTVGNITFNSNGYTIADTNNDSVLTLGGPSTITVTNAGHSATIGESLTAGAIIKAGAGTLVLSGNNTFSGAVSITSGQLTVGSNTALGDISGTTSISGAGQLELQNVTVTGEALSLATAGTDFFGGLRAGTNATARWTGSVTLESGARVGALSGGVLELSGPIQNGTLNSLVISATGTGASLGTVLVSGTSNTYTGTTNVFRGVLKLGATNALPVGTTLDLDSTSAAEDSILDLNGFSQTIGGLTRSGVGSGAGGSFITNTGSAASTLTVNQANTSAYSGVIQNGSSAVSLTKSGAGTLTLSGSSSYSGATTVAAGTLILTAANTTTGQYIVNNGGILEVGHAQALGSTSAGTLVNSGGRVVLQNGLTVTGENISITGTGGSNNSGALQTASNATATWNGGIITTSGTDNRIGGGDNGTLIVNGIISGTGGILYSRGTNATTVLNNLNTYVGDTQIYASTGTATLQIGIDNAISSASRLSVIATAATSTMRIDLNGRVQTLRALDTTSNHATGNFLSVLNNGSSPSVLTLSADSGTTSTQIFNGRVNDGTGGMSLVKNGSFTQTFIAAQGYTGSTTVNAGTLQIGGSVSTLGVNGALASTNIILNGGMLALDNVGASNNSTNRLANNAMLTFRGGSFVFRGSELAASSETVGDLALSRGHSIITVGAGSGRVATLTAAQFTRSAGGGIALVNGTNLGMDATSTANVPRIFLTTSPTLIGTTDALATGINSGAKNTKIVPYLLGESAGVGTVTGTPNTFLTYDPGATPGTGTGLRPLSLADEFTQNAFTSGHNTYITADTSLTATASINSLILNGTTITASIGSGRTLTVESGAILFSGGTNITLGGGGTLNFGNQEGIITINAAGNTNIGSVITGSNGVSYYGTGVMVTNQQHTYSGDTALYVGTSIPQVSSIGTAGAPTSGPYGTGTIVFAGASMRASTAGDVILHNNIRFQADTTIINGSVNRTLTYAGNVTLNDGSRTLTNQSSTNTYFTGVIGDAGQSYGLNIAGAGTGQVVLSGNNTYTGPTALTGPTTLLINGNQSAATGAVTVSAGVLGGTGTIGGATTIASGGTLNPGDPNTAAGIGRLNLAQGLTLQVGAVTNLQITGATFTSLDSFGGNVPGSSGYEAYVLANASGQGNHDQINITGTINQTTGSKINVLSQSFTPAAGQIFNLLDWSAATGNAFSSGLGSLYRDGSGDNGSDLDLPDISASGLFWDTSYFASHGILVVVPAVIPEVSRAFCFLIGLMALTLRRRR